MLRGWFALCAGAVWMEFVGFVAAVSLGLILLSSGVSKLRDPRGFVLGVLEYAVLPRRLALAAGWSLPTMEIVCGAAILAGLQPRLVGPLAGVLLASFLAAVGVNLARGRTIDCHCFGPTASEPIGLTTLVRLLVLLVLSALVTARGSSLLVLPPADAATGVLLAAATLSVLYLSQAAPLQWVAWRTKVAPGTRLFGGCVSYRRTHVSFPVTESAAGQGEAEPVGAMGGSP